MYSGADLKNPCSVDRPRWRKPPAGLSARPPFRQVLQGSALPKRIAAAADFSEQLRSSCDTVLKP